MTALTALKAKFPMPNLGGTIGQYRWNCQGQEFSAIYETLGQGTPVLLLPAFSTVSTRTEMGEIARVLATRYQVTALDWLGFGQSDRPSLDYQPELYRQLLQDFVNAIYNVPVTIVAAGHAAGYALQVAVEQPQLVSKLVLVAPTWQGPLRVMGAPSGIREMVKQMVRSPVLGQLLYFLNTRPSFLCWMYRRHVYVDREKLTPDLIARKYQMTQQPGARFAPAAFVTGAIDPVSQRSEFLALLQSLSLPALALIAEQAPPTSKAEMNAIAQERGIQSVRLSGTLGLHEENALEVARAILDFI
jgi:pimeloyl-ACP methyl ester carboxylesterase